MGNLAYLAETWNNIYKRDSKRWGHLHSKLADITLKFFDGSNEIANVLDFASGYGRDALLFQSKGYNCNCLDGSLVAIEELRKLSNSENKIESLGAIHMDVSEVSSYNDILNDSDLIFSNYFFHLLDFKELRELLTTIKSNIQSPKYISFNLISDKDVRFRDEKIGYNNENIRWTFWNHADIFNFFKSLGLEFLFWEEEKEIEFISNIKDEVTSHFIIARLDVTASS